MNYPKCSGSLEGEGNENNDHPYPSQILETAKDVFEVCDNDRFRQPYFIHFWKSKNKKWRPIKKKALLEYRWITDDLSKSKLCCGYGHFQNEVPELSLQKCLFDATVHLCPKWIVKEMEIQTFTRVADRLWTHTLSI